MLILEATEELQRRGAPLCREFLEMVVASGGADESSSVAPTRQAFEVATRGANQAAATAASVVTMCPAYAHSTNLDDEASRELVTLATLYALRFEEYLAERTAGDRI
jgi:hypothetical protein